MFKFGFPEILYLLLLIPAALVFTYYGSRRRDRLLSRFAQPELVRKLSRSASAGRRKLKACLPILALFFLILALARPQFGNRIETVKREGQDIIVALDVSLSMLAQDIRPSRLEKAKLEIASMLDLLQGDRIGLIAFAGEAFLLCPLTLDYGAARMFLSAMGPDLISLQGTSIAEAVEKSLQAFEQQEKTNKILILITDGEDHSGRVSQAAEKAAEAGVIVYAVGIGSPAGIPIPLRESGGGFKKDENGNLVLTRLVESPLMELAEKTGGQYFRAAPDQQELDTILSSIAAMDKKELSTRQVTIFDEKYQIFLALGLLILAVEFLIFESRKTDGAWKGRFE